MQSSPVQYITLVFPHNSKKDVQRYLAVTQLILFAVNDCGVKHLQALERLCDLLQFLSWSEDILGFPESFNLPFNFQMFDFVSGSQFVLQFCVFSK